MNTPPQLPNGYTTAPSGLIVPPSYNNVHSSLSGTPPGLVQHKLRTYSYFCADGFSYGVRLPRDKDTLVIQWAPKGSGIDDLLSAAIANVGIAPVMWDQLSALILRRQEQVNSLSVLVTGRSTPASRTLNALACMNDSPLGVIAGTQRILYQ